METILIADEHEIVRVGIRKLIENLPQGYTILEADSWSTVFELLSAQRVNYAILDLFLTDGNLFSVIQQAPEYRSLANILVYSMGDEKTYARRLLKKGIRGFVSKQAPLAELERGIHCILKGEIYLSENLKEQLLWPEKSETFMNPLDVLSDREFEVAGYLIAGLGAKEISQQMRLDITTVSTYRRRAFEKLGVKNNMELKERFIVFNKM